MSRRVGQRSYALLAMSGVYGCAAIDWWVFAILLQPIKVELSLSDTEIGLLGFVVSLCSVAFGVLLGRLADLWNRVNVIVISLLLFSVMTAFCSFAESFWQFLVLRIGTAVFSGGTHPAATSIIGELYPEKSRGGAMSIYTIGGYIGGTLVYAVGGILAEHFGWRDAMRLVALPGVLLSLVIYLTVREPHGDLSKSPGVRYADDGLFNMEVLGFLWKQKSLRYLTAGAALAFLCVGGFGTWLPAYFQRSFGVGSGETGLLMGAAVGPMSAVGILAAGFLGDRVGRRDPRWYAWIVSIALSAAFPFFVLTSLAQGKIVAIVAYTIPAMLSASYLGPTFALVQGLARVRMRAVAVASMVVVVNGIGGLGPQIVGALSDLLHTRAGADALRYSLLAISPGLILAATCFYRAAKHIPGDLARARCCDEVIPHLSTGALR